MASKGESAVQDAVTTVGKPGEDIAGAQAAQKSLGVEPAVAGEAAGEPRTMKEKLLDRAKRFGVVPAVEDDRKIERAKRFGLQVPELGAEKRKEPVNRFGLSEGDARAERAKRFGLQGQASPEKEKQKVRAARFGMGPTETDAAGAAAGAAGAGVGPSEAEKLRLRKARFGGAPANASTGASVAAAAGSAPQNGADEARKQSRAARFGLEAPQREEDKKKQRLERFAASAPED